VTVCIISNRDSLTGSGIAAYRNFQALNSIGEEIEMLVRVKNSIDPGVETINYEILSKYINHLRIKVSNVIYGEKNPSGIYASNLNLPSFIRTEKFRKYRLLNIHWIGDETISIENLIRIGKPLIWTCHDAWSILPRFHNKAIHNNNYENLDDYSSKELNSFNKLLDHVYYQRKFKLSKHIECIISPSKWLKDLISKSNFYQNHQIEVIPNPVPGVFFKPNSTFQSYKSNFDKSKKTILFGGSDIESNPSKGLSQVIQIYNELRKRRKDIELAIFGNHSSTVKYDSVNEIHWLGRIDSTKKLAQLYKDSHLLIYFSDIDNLPQVLTEAQASGLPIISKKIGGIPDIIEHNKNGFLVNSTEDRALKTYIDFLLDSKVNYDTFSAESVKHAFENYSYDVVANKYKKLFDSL
jgi:glycosyltransferase involved in cell wall biosynthesis